MPLRWTSSGVLIRPVSDATHSIVSVKDPTVVRHNDRWHVYATVYSTSARTWSMVDLNFKDWSEAPRPAKLHFVDQNPNLRGYHCAPQVFLTLVEAIGPARYYRAWVSDRWDGAWTPVPEATTFQQPCAGINNVTFEDGVTPWTRDISHGELIRDGYDETMTLDPDNLQLLYQGRDPSSGGRYELLPYQLGLLKQAPANKP